MVRYLGLSSSMTCPPRFRRARRQGPAMNTLFALVLPCDISALSGTSQIFSPKPINNDAADVAQSFAGQSKVPEARIRFQTAGSFWPLRLAGVPASNLGLDPAVRRRAVGKYRPLGNRYRSFWGANGTLRLLERTFCAASSLDRPPPSPAMNSRRFTGSPRRRWPTVFLGW
jgi:hypothetical protein